MFGAKKIKVLESRVDDLERDFLKLIRLVKQKEESMLKFVEAMKVGGGSLVVDGRDDGGTD